MTTETTKSVYWQGVRDGAPFILVIVPFSLLFGVVATEAGLNVLRDAHLFGAGPSVARRSLPRCNC